MYTPEMATEFKKIVSPKNFGVILYDNDDFVTVQIEPKDLLNLSSEEKIEAVQYINNVKDTLEKLGAIVFIVREAIEEND
jgi:dihydrodipicolinate synthase/N-acetylneuraminate lyase